MIRTFFRIVRTNPPTEQDFYSYERLGIVDRRPTPTSQRLRRGVSVYSTLARAEAIARTFPRHGAYIAMIEIGTVAGIAVEQTGGDPFHYTVWGDPTVLLDLVVRAIPVALQSPQ